MSLTKKEVNDIMEAQDRARRNLATGGVIACPFQEIKYSRVLEICILCHKWMETNLYNSHPCTDLERNMDEVRRRFWKDPRKEKEE